MTPPTERLSGLALDRLDGLRTEADGLLALSEFCGLLDPGHTTARYRLAGIVAAHLQRFEAAAWVRIRRGGREPRGPAEAAMCAMLRADLPRSRRRIVDLIG